MSSNSRIAVIVAIIGLIGVLGAAIIGNWDKIFSNGGKPPTTDTTNVVTTTPEIEDTANQVKVDPSGTTTKRITIPVDQFGNWGSSRRSDNEMDTKPGKYWQAQCVSQLSKTKSVVSLHLTYRVWENRNDHTKTM